MEHYIEDTGKPPERRMGLVSLDMVQKWHHFHPEGQAVVDWENYRPKILAAPDMVGLRMLDSPNHTKQQDNSDNYLAQKYYNRTKAATSLISYMRTNGPLKQAEM